MEIIPAIIPKTYADLTDKLSLVASLVPLVQIDICDGKFVPEASWPYKKFDENFEHIVEEKEGFPFWDRVATEFDLMVERPEEEIETWISAGGKRIVVHIESGQNIEAIVSKYGKKDFESPWDIELGVAIGIATPNELLEPFIDRIHFVQCMGIAKIGFQGQPFDPRVLEKIGALKKRHPDLIISVDGGVTLENAPALKASGAARLVAGSSVFGSDTIAETIKAFGRI